MESEPHIQLDLPYCIPTVIDGIPSQQLSESSHLRTTFFQHNAQNDSMLGFPLLPSLQGQSFKDIHADRTVSCGGLISRGSFEELCLKGPTFATDSLPVSTILASRNELNSDANTSANIQYEVPSASPKPMFSGGSSYASSSSIPTALRCRYDGSFGSLNDRWDNNRCLMQHNMNWRASTYELEPIRFSESEDAKNEWVLPSSDNVCSRHPYAENSTSHNELSLSLATCSPSLPSDLSCSGVVHSSKSQADDSSHCRKELSLGCTSNSRSMSVKFSPIISGSKYVSVLQQILSEISSYSLDSLDKISCNGDNLVNPSSNLQFSSNHFFDPTSSFKLTSSESHDYDVSREVAAGSSKKSQMLALLQMVDDQYNRCLDEIHMVISAFHAATDLEPQLHSCFALQTISFFYKNLRERISSQILAMGVYNESGRDTGISIDKSFIQKQWTLQQLKKKDQLWRPQRGLPERSVAVLRAWMFDNFLHPYPKDAEKHLLAIKSGLTRSQVSNWFINARVRLWKPLVEEMCAELHRRKGGHQNDEGTNNNDNSGRQLSIYNHNMRFNI